MPEDTPILAGPDPDPIGRAEKLRQSADESARLVRTLFITFLVIGVYIAITIGGTTDVQLLKVAPVKLPLLDIGLPIVGFYAVVPWLFLIVHLNLLLQFYLLGRKLHAFNKEVELLEPAERWGQRERLFPLPFSHMLAGHQHSRLVKVLLAAMVWTTVVILPLVLLIWAEVRFQPYRDPTVTWVQRAAVAVDLLGLWLFWPIIMTSDELNAWWRGFFQSFGTHLLLRLWARLRAGMRWIRPRVRLHRGALRRWRRLYTPRGLAHGSRGLVVTTLAALGVYGLIAAGVWTDSVFRQNLNLQEAVLVRGAPPAKVIAAFRGGDKEKRERALKRVQGLDLLRRDLREANLFRAVLPKADLRGARLEGAELHRAQLHDANLFAAGLDGADLRGAGLQGANLFAAGLEGVDLSSADLEGADLSGADLQGAKFYSAQLQGADLIGAKLEGAKLFSAQLKGADLTNADLEGAQLEGADLSGANLSGADLSGADLKRAVLHRVKTGCPRTDLCTDLTHANLWRAQLTGVNLRVTKLTGAKLDGACGTGVRLPEGYSVPPCDDPASPSVFSPTPNVPVRGPRIIVHQD